MAVVAAAEYSALASLLLKGDGKCPSPAEKNRVLAKFFDDSSEQLVVLLPVLLLDVKYHDLRRPRTMFP